MTTDNYIAIDNFILGDAVLLDRQPSVVTATALLPQPVWGLEGFALLSGSEVIVASCDPSVGGVVVFERIDIETLPAPLFKVSGELRIWRPETDPAVGAQMVPYGIECHEGGNTPVITVTFDGKLSVFLPKRSIDLSDLTILPVPKVLHEEEPYQPSRFTALVSYFRRQISLLRGKFANQKSA